MKNERYGNEMKKAMIPFYTLFAMSAVTLGSFSFGFETVIISFALPLVADAFGLSLSLKSLAVSILLLGAVVGVLFSGPLSDRFGRKKAIIVPAFLFVLSTCIVYTSNHFLSFLVGRFISGIAVGFVSSCVPLFISEIAPKELRGRLVAMHQVMICAGVFSALVLGHLLLEQSVWKSMFFWGGVPPALLLICMPFVSDSPGWLLAKGYGDRAYRSAAYYCLDMEAKETSSLLKKHSFQWRDLIFNPKIRLSLLIGGLLNLFQQITGINTLLYFVPEFIKQAGIASEEKKFYATVLIGFVNILFAFLASFLLDKVGRKILLIVSLAGMCLSLSLMILMQAYATSFSEMGVFIFLVTYVSSFGLGMGPAVIVVCSEIFPLSIRGRALSFCFLVNWTTNFLVTLSFLPLEKLVGLKGILAGYAGLCILAILIVCCLVPETKGKSLSEIEKSNS
ncbi:MAG: MFS transporter [Chlamydiae bacterium]|nr:MFS transporter [Chlamydiota bacterium]